ncbi:MAG: response regulator [Pseudomonadota bacterium]
MKRCIIFDTAPIIRKVAKRILTSDDLIVIEAESGRDTLTKAEFDMADYFILDAGVRDMELNDLIANLRTMQRKTNIKPFIVVSMHELDLVRMTRAKRAGANELLLKPFDRQTLLDQFASFNVSAEADAA